MKQPIQPSGDLLRRESKTADRRSRDNTGASSYEYRRSGTANLFVLIDAHCPWWKVKVTERPTSTDFAVCMRELSDVHIPEADRIRVVLDNLSTHTPTALYNSMPTGQARRILHRIKFHCTPKHASWLEVAAIEIGVLQRQCLSRRIPDLATLEAENAKWE